MIENKTLEQIQQIIASGETCVLNLTASWCSDCTDQAHNLEAFSHNLNAKQVTCYTFAVQQERNVYLSEAHQVFTEFLGGHGFPRTVLVTKGKVVDAENVEIISAQQLTALSEKFIKQL